MDETMMHPTVSDPANVSLDLTTRLLQASPQCIFLVGRDYGIRMVNRRAIEVLGASDLVGRNMLELYPAVKEEPFFSNYESAMAGESRSFLAYYPAPLHLWFEVAAEPDPVGMLLFLNDVTARVEAEQREQEMAERLQQVLEATSDAVLTIDRDWRFTLLNKRASEMIDPEHRMLGKVIWDVFPALRGSETEEIFNRTMHQGLTGDFETFYPAPLDRWYRVVSVRTLEGMVVFFRDITEQREHDRVVAEQQELLAMVQGAARMATWELNAVTGSVWFGPGSSNLFGRPMTEVNTLAKLSGVMLPGHAEKLAAAIERGLESGEMVVMEFAVKAADGTTVWLESRGQAVLGSGSEFGGERTARLRGMSIDVTQRKLDQQELIASEERYRVLADLNPQAIWAGNAAGNITYANQGFLAYLGLKTEDLNGAGWLEGFTPADRERVVKVWTHSVATGDDYEIEAMLRHAPTGEYRYWHLRAAAVRDKAGAIVQWLGVGNDIHDVKMNAAMLQAERTEAEFRRTELEAVYSSTPVALALLDPVEFRFLNMNDLEAELLGQAKEDVLGKRLEEIAPIPGLKEMMKGVAGGCPVRDMVVEGTLPATGEMKRYWTVNYSPVYDDRGNVRSIVAASIEITHQKRAEAALIQSEKLAAVGRLASSISHEINNPLEAITNLLYLIAHDTQLPEELKIYVHMAQSELSRVSQIATQTLRFHRQAVNPTYVTAADLVGAVVRLYTGRLSNSNIKVEACYSTDTQILCFENDIRQVLNNLIANAIDAMRMGGKLLVRAHEATDKAGRPGVRITVADTGHGMSEDVLRRVFEPFYTTKDLNGTGLGLWISAGIVERHQGRLTVRSSVDPVHHGTVFALFLPREEVTTL